MTTTEVERFGDRRAGMRGVESDSSHPVMPSHSKAVADVIRGALRFVSA